jgi:methylase of polypeptide subunit release factors
MNAARAELRIRVLHGDLTGPVAKERFDVVVSNPPYVPTPPVNRTRRHMPMVAWEAGRGVGRPWTGSALTPETCSDRAVHCFWCTPDFAALKRRCDG